MPSQARKYRKFDKINVSITYAFVDNYSIPSSATSGREGRKIAQT
jgi:hypothetical protein